MHTAAALSHVAPAREALYNFMYEPGDGSPQHNCDYRIHEVRIDDARAVSPAPSLHAEGFELRQAPSAVRDFRDDEEVRKTYYAECARLACEATGGTRAYVFDHLVRRREAGRPALTFGRHGDGTRPAAAGRIHNDYTESSGRRRLALVLGEDAARSVRRFCIVNIWRSIAGPIVDTPLALCDARTVKSADLVRSEVRYRDRTGEIYLLAHSPRHRWLYYSRMDRDEALVFKQFDSAEHDGLRRVPRFVPHSAFDLPDIPPDAPLRESIEARCLVVMA